MLVRLPVERKRQASQLSRIGLAQDLLRLRKRDVLVVLPILALGGRSKHRLRQLRSI